MLLIARQEGPLIINPLHKRMHSVIKGPDGGREHWAELVAQFGHGADGDSPVGHSVVVGLLAVVNLQSYKEVRYDGE